MAGEGPPKALSPGPVICERGVPGPKPPGAATGPGMNNPVWGPPPPL
ncbi:MAG: hypothetical protein CM15mP60_0040 [Alphaproteobacteria bacterium]|nr:MAG: hypothetical protein CM15mP60_0040 [Alphaproteobacteria bacterium]